MSITVPRRIAKRVYHAPAHRVQHRYKKKRRSAKRTVPLTVALPIAFSFFLSPDGSNGSPVSYAQAGNWEGVGSSLIKGWTGFDTTTGTFGGIPRYLIIAGLGVIAHKTASALGINRHMAKLPSPLNKVAI